MKKCESCGKVFDCQVEAPSPCWCQSLPVADLIPNPYKDCLCPGCLSALSTLSIANKNPKPVEGQDFYYENGFLVFTGAYHLKRGYCCKSSESGCRHCPYR